ncbi:MAG: diguanylate cyclase [Desulfobulbaceae bacterium]|nr:diguanylate cyclase [Desulfobulbaceae bacterium]
MINESYLYAQSLAAGELSAETSRDNIFSMPLKALQASLRHLSWQTNQVAAGDLNQRVTFLGEFSLSFNRMVESLRDKEALELRLKTITDTLGEGVYLVDPLGCLVFANPEAERLLGYSQEEMIGEPIFITIHRQKANGTIHPHEGTRLAAAIKHSQDYHDDNCIFSCKSGLLMPVSVNCRPVQLDGTLQGSVIAFHDITKQKKYQDSLHTINSLLEKQASIDSLTGIYNRMKLGQLLKVEITRASRYKSALSIIMFDVDHFKSVNDTFGHQSGDSVLMEIATVIGSNIRPTDIFARWGGEEFMTVVPGCDLDQGLLVANKLRLILAETTFS